MDDELTYVYIMGRAHSGTTVLDCLLDNVDGIQGCGELAVGLPRLSDPESLNLPDGSRPFWKAVKQEYQSRDYEISWSQAVHYIHDQAHISNIFSTWTRNPDNEYITSVMKSTKYIFESICSVSDSDYIVDASKEVTRASLLARFSPNVKIIHLVRNPEDVVASTLHRIRYRHGFRFLRSDYDSQFLEPLFIIINSVGWLIGNMICETINIKHPEKTITIKYENLTSEYRETLKEIGHHIGKDTSRVIRKIENKRQFSTGNKISGNRLLEKESFVFETAREPRELPGAYRHIARIFSLPLRIKYEYY